MFSSACFSVGVVLKVLKTVDQLTMLLTPLLVQTQSWNQQFTDSRFSLHRSVIFWDVKSLQFTRETGKRHNFLWWFGNFVGIGGCALPCFTILLLQSLHNPSAVTVVDSLIGAVQCCVLLTIMLVARACISLASDTVAFFKIIVSLEANFCKYSKKPTTHKNNFLMANGKVDVFGMISIWIVVAGGIMQIVVPCAFMWQELDFVILPLKLNQRLGFELPFFGKVMFHVIRVLFVLSTFTEIFLFIRTYTTYGILIFRGIELCHSLLLSQPVNMVMIMEHCRLRIAVSVIRDFIAVLLAVVLAGLYAYLILSSTVVLTMGDVMTWYLYDFFFLSECLTICVVGVVLGLAVSVDRMSAKLLTKWKRSSCRFKFFPRQMRLLRRKVRSVKPIGIPYGSLGTFTAATRTDYFYSLTLNSINAALAVRETQM